MNSQQQELSPAQCAFIEMFGEHPARIDPRPTWTRFLDVPFEELCGAMRQYGNQDLWESHMRGKPVQLMTGTTRSPFPQYHDGCGGPYFWMTNEFSHAMIPGSLPDTAYMVCGHLILFD